MAAGQIDNVMKIAALICNGNEKCSYAMGKVEYQHFDNMTSELMVHFLSSLLLSLNPNFDEQTSRSSRLVEFEQFQICSNMSYDSYADQIFQAARKLFPPNDDRLDLSLILFPQQDIRRAKSVINYLVSFNLLCDSLYETFENEWDSIHAENKEKMTLYEDIEEVKNAIATQVHTIQSQKDAKPLLEEELVEVEKQVLKGRAEVAKLEDSCKSDKKHYDEVMNANTRLQAQLESLLSKKKSLESQIVYSGSEKLLQHDVELQKLMEERKQRNDMGDELKKTGAKVKQITQVIETSKSAVEKFEALIEILKVAEVKLNQIAKLKHHLELKLKESEKTKKEINSYESNQSRQQLEHTQRCKYFQTQISNFDQMIIDKHSALEYLEYQCNEIMSELEEIYAEQIEIKQKIKQEEFEINEFQHSRCISIIALQENINNLKSFTLQAALALKKSNIIFNSK